MTSPPTDVGARNPKDLDGGVGNEGASDAVSELNRASIMNALDQLFAPFSTVHTEVTDAPTFTTPFETPPIFTTPSPTIPIPVTSDPTRFEFRLILFGHLCDHRRHFSSITLC